MANKKITWKSETRKVAELKPFPGSPLQDFFMPDPLEGFSFDLKEKEESQEKKIHLYHYLPGFMGCFALNICRGIDWEGFLEWKKNPNKETTRNMAIDFLPYIQQKFDLVTTAPASTNRNMNNYCANKLGEEVGKLARIPFVQVFQQRKDKVYHGRFASIKQESPILTKDGLEVKKKTILWVDDYINSGITARNCFKVLAQNGNHIDGLIWARH